MNFKPGDKCFHTNNKHILTIRSHHYSKIAGHSAGYDALTGDGNAYFAYSELLRKLTKLELALQ